MKKVIVCLSCHQAQFAYVISAFFFLVGILVVRMLPAPIWFEVSDLLLPYFSTAWLATFVGGRFKN